MIMPDVWPGNVTVTRADAERYLPEWEPIQGPALVAVLWALTGWGSRPLCGDDWDGRLPEAADIRQELERGSAAWDGAASHAEVDRARALLWWLSAPADAEVPPWIYGMPTALR
jgi:hypothetical protein